MNQNTHQNIFIEGFHAIPLGHMDKLEDSVIVTLDDLPGRESHGFKIWPADVTLLESIDVTVTNRIFSPEDQNRLLEMADQNIVALVTPDVEIFNVNLIPVRRKKIDLASVYNDSDDGATYHLQVDDGAQITTDTIGAQLIINMNGVNSIGQILQKLYDTIQATPDGPATLHAAEEADGASYSDYLRDVTYQLLQDLLVVKAISIEISLN